MGSSYVRQVAPAPTLAFLNMSGAATASTTLIMAGWGKLSTPTLFTPVYSGNILALLTGGTTTATALANISYQLYYNSGGAPSAGAGVTGNALGTLQVTRPATFADVEAIAISEVALGLSVGTQYWFDLAYQTGTTGDHASFSNCDLTLVELVS